MNCRTLALNIGSYTDCINLCTEGGKWDTNFGPVISTIRDGVNKTTGNIRILLSLIISRKVQDEPILF